MVEPIAEDQGLGPCRFGCGSPETAMRSGNRSRAVQHRLTRAGRGRGLCLRARRPVQSPKRPRAPAAPWVPCSRADVRQEVFAMKRSGPSPKIRRRIKATVSILAQDELATLVDAAKRQGLPVKQIHYDRKQFPEIWQREYVAGLAQAGRPRKNWTPARAKGATDNKPMKATAEILEAAATLVAAGFSITQAADRLGIKVNTLRSHRRRHPDVWQHFYDQAEARQEPGVEVVVQVPLPYSKRPRPSPDVHDRIRKATAMLATGMTRAEVTQALGLGVHTISEWRSRYTDLFQQEYDRAMEAALVVVRRQAGTEAVLEDPAGYIRQALAVERWASESGQDVLPTPTETTLTTFFRTHYAPARLVDPAPRSRESYEHAMRLWALFTGDPPLAKISDKTLQRFRGCLTKMQGLSRVGRVSPNTVRKHLRHVQAVLDHAGPRVRHHRDAAGLLSEVPWVRPPREVFKSVRVVSMEELSNVYLATAAMDKPRLYGVKAPRWWRALLTMAFNTGLRRGALFGLQMRHIDWHKQRLVLPPELSKTKRGQILPLNEVTMRHLIAIRTHRELVFEWPHCRKWFHAQFHRLQDAAGIPEVLHFGLHDIRRTVATLISKHASPHAAQLALGHTMFRTTAGHYIDSAEVIGDAMNRLPQPEAFLGEQGGTKANAG